MCLNNFSATNFPFLCSNIQTSPAYGVFISQLIRYARVCCFILRATWLSNKLLEQEYVTERLKPLLRKCYGRYGISSINMKSPSHESVSWPSTVTFLPNSTFLSSFYRTFATGAAYDRGCLLLWTPGPVPFGTCICSSCWEHFWLFSWLNVCTSNINVYFLDFACNIIWQFVCFKLVKTNQWNILLLTNQFG